MSKVALPMVGIFDTTLGRLVGISPEGATDVTTVATVETNLVTGGSGILLDGRVVVPEEEQAYKLPPAKVRITATQIVVGKPIGLKSVKCVVGTAIALTIYDNGTAAAGTVLFTQTMSAGDEWSVPTAIQAVNGLQATFTGTATFDVEVQDAA